MSSKIVELNLTKSKEELEAEARIIKENNEKRFMLFGRRGTLSETVKPAEKPVVQPKKK